MKLDVDPLLLKVINDRLAKITGMIRDVERDKELNRTTMEFLLMLETKIAEELGACLAAQGVKAKVRYDNLNLLGSRLAHHINELERRS